MSLKAEIKKLAQEHLTTRGWGTGPSTNVGALLEAVSEAVGDVVEAKLRQYADLLSMLSTQVTQHSEVLKGEYVKADEPPAKVQRTTFTCYCGAVRTQHGCDVCGAGTHARG